MALTEKVTFLLSVNAKGVAKEFDKVGREADRSLGKAEERSEKLAATFTKVGAGMVAAGALAGAALYGMAQDAASMAETTDKAAILFGDGLERVVEFSEGAAKAIGVAKDQALDAASTFAIYGKRAGLAGDDLAGFSTELVQAAGDMASFNDASIADTIDAIGSGLRGESEPLQRFGVDTRVAALEAAALEAGIIGVGESLTAAQQPLAVMAAIQQQASDQMGNFALTSESAANQQKQMAAEVQNLRLELGEAALPVLREVLTALNAMVGSFNALPAPIKNVIGQTVLWGSALLTFGGLALMAVGRVKDLGGAADTLAKSLGTSKRALVGWGLALGAALVAYNAWQSKSSEIEAGIDSIAAAMDAAATPADGLAMHLEGLLATNDDFRKAAEQIGGDVIPRMAEALLEGGAAADAMYQELAGGGFDQAKLPLFFLNLAEDVGKAKDQMEETRNVMSGMGGDSQRLGEEVRMLGNRAFDAGSGVDELDGSFRRATPRAMDLVDAIDQVNRELAEFFGSIQSAEEAEADFQKALDDAAKSIEENGSALGTNTERQRANLAARGDVIASIEGVVHAMMAEGASSDEIVAKAAEMVAGYEATALAAGASEEQARELTAALDDIPDEVEAELELVGYDEALAQAQALQSELDRMERLYKPRVEIESSSSGGGGSTSNGTVSDPDFELAPLGEDRSKPRRMRNFDVGNGGSRTKQPINIFFDSREVANALVDESHGRGGLDIMVRGGRRR